MQDTLPQYNNSIIIITKGRAMYSKIYVCIISCEHLEAVYNYANNLLFIILTYDDCYKNANNFKT